MTRIFGRNHAATRHDSRRPHQHGMTIEGLERRTLLTAAMDVTTAALAEELADAAALNAELAPVGNEPTFTLDDGVLHVTGTNGDDTIRALVDDEAVLHVEVNDVQFNVPSGDVEAIHVQAGDGHDSVRIAPGVEQHVRVGGGAGRDHIRLGGGHALVHGGAGDDVIIAVSSGSEIHGDGGNDLIVGSAEHDRLFGGMCRR